MCFGMCEMHNRKIWNQQMNVPIGMEREELFRLMRTVYMSGAVWRFLKNSF